MDDLQAAIDELLDLTEADGPPRVFDIETFCGGHEGQLAVARSRDPFIHLMWARQTGKTQICDALMAENAEAHPGSTNILLHLTGTAVEMANWFPVWKGHVAPLAGIPDDWHNETERVTYYPNNSRVCFSGTDDMRNIKKWLGNRLDHGIIIIDEAQDQPEDVLWYILRKLLPPMLTPTTRVILAGVLPDAPVGMFYELAHPTELHGEECKCEAWRHFECGRASNVHTPGALEQERERMRKQSIPEDDPEFLRDWLLARVWTTAATAYAYVASRNGYHPEVPAWLAEATRELPQEIQKATACLMAAVPFAGIEFFSVALDIGGTDRCAIEASGWGSKTEFVQHLFDWSTHRKMLLGWDACGQILGLVAKFIVPKMAGQWWWYDSTSKNELDTFGRLYGVPVLKPAVKADMPGQVKLVNRLLGKPNYKVMIGSSLEEDFKKARWDQGALAKKIWRWSAQWHPDPSEANRYSLRPYFDAFQPPEEKPKDDLEQHRAEVRIMLREAKENDRRESDPTGGLWG